MTRYQIKLRFSEQSDAELLASSQTILLLMTGNSNYTTPNPTLLAFAALVSDFSGAISLWGTVGNRGSHSQHINVLDTRAALEVGTATLATYCETTTPYDRTAFLSGGWEVRKVPAPIGPLPAPPNLRAVFSKATPNNGIKLMWGRLNGARSHNVLRSDDDGVTFHLVATITKASYIDTGLDSTITYQYIIQAVGSAGVGVNSDICYARPVMNPID